MTPEEEKVHFDTFGFIIRRGLFGPEEMQKFSHWFEKDAMLSVVLSQVKGKWVIPDSAYMRGSAVTTLMTREFWIR